MEKNKEQQQFSENNSKRYESQHLKIFKKEEYLNTPSFLKKSEIINKKKKDSEIYKISSVNQNKTNSIFNDRNSIIQNFNVNNNLNYINNSMNTSISEYDSKIGNNFKDMIRISNINHDNNDSNNIELNNEQLPINIININQFFNLYPNKMNKKEENFLNQNLDIQNWNNFVFNNNNLQNELKTENDNNHINHISNKDKIDMIIYNADIILSLIASYKGSIFLQKALLNIEGKKISILLTTIYPYICNIMCLEYGNYFMQKLIKKLNVEQRLSIYQIIENNFLIIATNKSGTHAIQTLIDTIQTPLEQIFLNKLLNKNMLLLFNNENGYHIIMKIILEIPENQRDNINLFIVSNVEKIIINPYGAYCVCKFIIYNNNLNLRFLLIKNIQNNIKNLIFNKNSCSVLMSSIKQFGITNFEFIIHEIKNNITFLSLHPISSSFIGKIFCYLENNEYIKLTSIIWEIFKNDDVVKQLFSHKNGKIILKKLISYSNNAQKKYINTKINITKKK